MSRQQEFHASREEWKGIESGKRTKHIDIRHFFITDRINKGELLVEWCPTGDMVGDFATKPLQGAAFAKFRDMIMGAIPMDFEKKKPARGKLDAKDNKPRKGKKSLVPQKAAPQECVGEKPKRVKPKRVCHELAAQAAKSKTDGVQTKLKRRSHRI